MRMRRRMYLGPLDTEALHGQENTAWAVVPRFFHNDRTATTKVEITKKPRVLAGLLSI